MCGKLEEKTRGRPGKIEGLGSGKEYQVFRALSFVPRTVNDYRRAVEERTGGRVHYNRVEKTLKKFRDIGVVEEKPWPGVYRLTLDRVQRFHLHLVAYEAEALQGLVLRKSTEAQLVPSTRLPLDLRELDRLYGSIKSHLRVFESTYLYGCWRYGEEPSIEERKALEKTWSRRPKARRVDQSRLEEERWERVEFAKEALEQKLELQNKDEIGAAYDELDGAFLDAMGFSREQIEAIKGQGGLFRQSPTSLRGLKRHLRMREG